MTQANSGFSLSKLVWGIALIAVGVFFTLRELDLVELDRYWRYWPLVFIAVGLAKIIQPDQGRGRGDGLGMVGLGVWLLIGSLELFGLSYGTAWPLLIVFIGIGIVWKALEHAPSPARKEDPHGAH